MKDVGTNKGRENTMERVKPNEIRIMVDGGLVTDIALGRDVPKNFLITLVDFDIEGATPEDDPRIQDDGYGETAFCSVFRDAEDAIPATAIDPDDGTVWL